MKTEDPAEFREYVLENGLRLFLAVHRDEPRIQARIAVRAGAALDPPGASGTAHLAEHLLFKGTREIGSLEPEAEEPGLRELAEMYVREPDNRRGMYRLADRLGRYADPLGWDRETAALGVGNGNAYTGYDGTVCMASVPSSALRAWLVLERRRFEEACPRLFSSEVEVVLDELRRIQDDDGGRLHDAVMETLGGVAPVQGRPREAEALTPGGVMAWMRRYYRPGSTALVLSGDLDPEMVLSQVREVWGDWQGLRGWPEGLPETPREGLPGGLAEGLPERREPRELQGPDSEAVQLVWPIPDGGNGLSEEQRALAVMAERVLHNEHAGLMDLRLTLEQRVRRGEAALETLPQGGGLVLSAIPRQGQSLEEAAELLRSVMEDLAAGRWDSRLMEAVVRDIRISRMESREENNLLDTCAAVFLEGRSWDDWRAFSDRLAGITKEELCRFVSDLLKEEPRGLFKRRGPAPELPARRYPPYTPLGEGSGGAVGPREGGYGSPYPRLAPRFVRYDEKIHRETLTKGRRLFTVENRENDLFDFQVIFPRGFCHSSLTLLAAGYLEFSGTRRLSSGELRQEFFYRGLDWGCSMEEEFTFLGITGTADQREGGLAMLRDLADEPQAAPGAFADFLEKLRQERQEVRKSRQNLLEQAMLYRAVSGEISPVRSLFSLTVLDSVSEAEVLEEIRRLWEGPWDLFHYGPPGFPGLSLGRKGPAEDREEITGRGFSVCRPRETAVYFYPYDQSQADIVMVSPGPLLDLSLPAYAAVFYELYGGGSQSLVFREFREIRALGYAGAAEYTVPERPEEPHLLKAQLGLPPDRAAEGIRVMLDLLNQRRVSEAEFSRAREAVLSRLEHERILRDDVFWAWYTDRRMGWPGDSRREVYQGVKAMAWDDWEHFMDSRVRQQVFSILLLGRREDFPWKELEKLGPVTEWQEGDLFDD